MCLSEVGSERLRQCARVSVLVRQPAGVSVWRDGSTAAARDETEAEGAEGDQARSARRARVT
jgi:hypothetical protein